LSVLARSLVDLLASPYRLAVVTAQHAVLAALESGEPAMWALLGATLDADADADAELCVRTLSVLEAYVEGGAALPSELLDALDRRATTRELVLRLAARRVLERHGRHPPPVPRRDLPASLSLVVPRDPGPAMPERSVPLGADSLDKSLLAMRHRLDKLADRAGVDRGALAEHVAGLARKRAGDKPVNDAALRSDHGVLGWSYLQPSFMLWDHAAQQAAAALVDSGRVPVDIAVVLTSGPMYDPTLIRTRPLPQPVEVPSALAGHSERWVSEESWLAGLEGAEQRLVRRLGDWVVIGELTDVRYLDRDMPRERRWQSLTAVAAEQPDPRPEVLWRMRLVDLAGGAMPSSERALIAHDDLDFRGPSEWLALSPFVADTCGWRPTDQALIGYRDAEGVVARSVWWQAGWPDSALWTSHEQVGQGWLVVVAPRALEALEHGCGEPLNVSWEVHRDFLAPGKSERSVIGTLDHQSGG
jgi:hypothetical protein